MTSIRHTHVRALVVLALGLGGAIGALADSFYTRGDLFAFRPAENRAGQTIDRLGPIGIGIELTLPAFGMKIRNVEEGSPAAATGELRPGQIIDTINGRRLADIDPRIQLGDLITAAEASDGRVVFVVRDAEDAEPRTLEVRIPVLGAYSETWPMDCAKSDRIVRNLADWVRQRNYNDLSLAAGQAMLFMLSTGEEADLAVVRDWAAALVERYRDEPVITVHNWTVGRAGIALGEYYLRTGDAAILPVISKLADCARWGLYNDGWAHGLYRGQSDRAQARMAFAYMGGGHMNACGVHIPAFLMLAKEGGADVDDDTLLRSLRQMFRFAARGNVPYGDQIPEQSFVDNGKTGGLAFTLAAAANLAPTSELAELYANARDNSAVKGFYSTSWMLIGHTGGGVGEIWRSAAMGLMAGREPVKHREFMDARRWFYELSRRHDGSLAIAGGGRYDQPDWGVMLGLTYTLPRGHLRLAGAPRSPHATDYGLPARRPWGNAADDVFYLNTPAVGLNGERYDEALAQETFLTGSSRAAFAVMADPEVTDDVLLRYAHHPDHGIRRGAASHIARHGRDHLVVPLLGSADPRVRHAGSMVIHCRFKRRPLPAARVTDDMVAGLVRMIRDPEEAWWGVENAMKALAIADPDHIAPQVDRLLEFVGHEQWWLSAAAMAPLARVAADERFYRPVLGAVANVLARNTRVSLFHAARGVFQAVRNADPQVQAHAVELLCRAYADFPTAAQMQPPDRISMEPAETYFISQLANVIAEFPAGLNALFPHARRRFPGQALPHADLYLRGDPARFHPEIQTAIEQHRRTAE